MSESATQPQSDSPSEAQTVIREPTPAEEPQVSQEAQASQEPQAPQEPPPPPEPPLAQVSSQEEPAPWHVSKGALLLIGVPLAGALVTWLGISMFGSNAGTSPADVVEQAAVEPALATEPVVEPEPPVESVVVSSAEPEPQQPADAEPIFEQPDAPTSAINEVIPNAPQSALNTITGTVRVSVRVTIDNDGAVMDAEAADPGPSRYFERLSVTAAKKWTFTPASSAERTMLVKFGYTREGVTARAVPDEE